ncbi:ABC transporter permease [Labrys monachus]|uniref:Spermidine/putrescine transport system permease protein n=1 Tax=Labrys monachus TaxID=217067 RepID=A0ABU0FBN9_9HYPH|nr:ABC transporter permease [Labrys monachus]MDQ0392032.1 spermidine/putrescine transport system permease protein [Labrys monachus]
MAHEVEVNIPRPARRRRQGWATAALLAPAYGWLLLAVFLPLCAMLFFSFLKTSPLPGRPLFYTVNNYLAFINRPYLFDVAWTSIRIGLWTTGLCAVIGLPAALALARATSGRSKHVLFLLIILPFWTNGLVRVFSWTMVLREGGLLDYALHLVIPGAPAFSLLYSFPAIIIGLVHAYLPYMILTCYLSASAIEDGYVEAARSLGARTPVVFWKILLPLSLPGLISGSILIFVPVIGSFMEPRILGGRIGVTMGTVIEDQFTAAFNWPLGAALSFIMLAVVLVIFAASARVLRAGGALQ